MKFKQKLAYMVLGGLILGVGIIIGQSLQIPVDNKAIARWKEAAPKYQFYPTNTRGGVLVGYLLNTESGELRKVVEPFPDEDEQFLMLKILSAYTGKDLFTEEAMRRLRTGDIESLIKRSGGQGLLMPPYKPLETISPK